MKYMIILVALISFDSHAFDFASLKKQALALFSSTKTEKVETISLPKIPKIKKNAMDSGVYKAKEYPISKQGESFKKLDAFAKQKFNKQFIKEVYREARSFDVSERELSQMMNVLSQGGSREGIYRNVVLGSFYLDLEEKNIPIGMQTIKYVSNFGRKYLGKDYSHNSLSKTGLYSLKRILCESSLEILDQMAPREKDVYAWYSIFSSELAAKFPKLWIKNKVRASTDVKYHYAWAKQVPFQHIKSEVIIKLNVLLNKIN